MNNDMNLNTLFQQFASNPLFQYAQKMAEGKSGTEIEQIAKNLCKEQGMNYDEVYAEFQNYMKGF